MSLTLTIIIPCYNEEEHIEKCLNSLFENRFNRDRWEILVIDGMSEDGTRDIVRRYSESHPFIRLIDNPERIKPIALNRGIEAANGEYVMRIDAHSTYSPGYVDALVTEIRKGEVQNVGGVQIAERHDSSFWGGAIGVAVSHPLAMGDAVHRFQFSGEPRLVNTVFCGCYPISVFAEVGNFNEQLIRTQDREFNERLLAAGGKILLLPGVIAHYRPRTKIHSYCRWVYQGAKWLFKARHYTDVSMARLRNFIPFVFLLYCLSLAPVALSSFPLLARLLWFLPMAVYLLALIFEGARQAFSESNYRLMLSFPMVVFATHLAYGAGSLAGLMSRRVIE